MQTQGGRGHKPMQRIIEVCLLVMLCRPENEHCHGYALGESLREFGFKDSEISVSTLYRTLRGMEESGWVTSDWAEGGPGPQRREYAVTDAGRTALDAWASVLQKRRERITRVLDEYALLGREPASDVNEEELIARGRHGSAESGAPSRRGAKKAPAVKKSIIPDEPETERQRTVAAQQETSSAAAKRNVAAPERREAENLNEYWD